MDQRPKPLAELHAHIGASADPWVMWSIAHAQGIKLPTKDYWEFEELATVSPDKPRKSLADYLKILHETTEVIQSSTFAMEQVTHEIIGEMYRTSNATVVELRYNPMKRNKGGQQDLDHIIMATLRGMDRALLEYPQVSAGLILSLDRQFTYEQNEVIAEKAIRYHRRGVIAIDFANSGDGTFHFKDYKELIGRCKKAGLKVTAHTGESPDTDDMWEAIEFAEPDRIGHGIRSAFDKDLMKELVKRDIVLEVCPSSNLSTSAVKNVEELKEIIRTLVEHKVKITINTDGPKVVKGASLKGEFEFLKRHKILDDEELETARKTAFEATFVKRQGIDAYL